MNNSIKEGPLWSVQTGHLLYCEEEAGVSFKGVVLDTPNLLSEEIVIFLE